MQTKPEPISTVNRKDPCIDRGADLSGLPILSCGGRDEMNAPKPRLVQRDKEPSKDEVFMAQVEQSLLTYLLALGRASTACRLARSIQPNDVDEITRRATYAVKVDAPVGWFSRVLRKVFRV